VTTISYDLPVADYVDALSATGHVTHNSFPKTSVTLHHNAGNLSHRDILSVWTDRPASAHFDVDSSGAIAQYVKVTEYAWAVGNTSGNESSISIEMADSSGDPDWQVSEATWKSAARLAAWLFAKVVREAPTSDNFFPHQHWSSTDCPGPYIMGIWPQILAEVQTQYANFTGGSVTPAPAPAPSGGKSVEELAHEVIAGDWGNGSDRVSRLTAAGYDANAVQAEVNRELNGATQAPPKKSIQEIAVEVIDGKWGNGPDRVSRLQAAGYDANAVQAEVNRELGVSSAPAPAPAPAMKPISEIASEVIAGDWGNGNDRINRLQSAGYDAGAVQAEVNRQLSGGSSNGGKSVQELAQEVIAGDWGNGDDRKSRLETAGYDYNAVQAEVNRELS
jgi:hypothetical protein